MATPININDSISVIPSGATNTSNLTASSSYPSSNAFTNHTSTTYAQYSLSRNTTGYTHYTFDVSDIPSGATITSITAQVKVRVNSTSYVTNTVCQLYANTTAKGSSYTFASTSASNVVNMTNTGSWTLSEVQNLRLRIGGTGSSSNYSKYIYMYGATVTINYSISGMQYTLTATSEVNGATITPVASQKMGGESETFTINPGSMSIDDLALTDNDIDVTSSITSQQVGGPGSISAVPGSNVTTGHARSNGAFYQSSSTSSDAWLRYAIGYSAESPYSTSNTSNTYTKDGTNDATTQGWMIYPFDFSSIPVNATITSVQVKCYGAIESTSQTASHADISLWTGNTQKGTTQQFTSTSNSAITLSDVGTWTRAELQDAKLRFGVGYYGGRLLGVTWTVNYTVPYETLYHYTLSNISADHDLVLSQAGAFIPPEEDPQKTYYSLTVSSINAITDPVNGTTRVEAGTNQTVTITPTDPQLTLALDNGVDVTSQLVGGIPTNTYTITTQVSGASYGFNLNSGTGYYVSTNGGVGSSASVARVNFDLESSVLVTIQYINQGESQADYGLFGKIDTTVSTNGLTYSGSSASPDDPNNYYYMCATAADSSTSVKTLTYEIPSGQHYIDIKYGKDQASNDGYDSLQWKILNIEATSAGGDYTYTLTNIQQKHSLIFVFGDVDFYYLTSIGTNSKIYPDGQIVKLEGDNYSLVIVPNDTNATVTLLDNGVDRTNLLEYEEGEDKNHNLVVNYTYRLTNITANHTLTVTCSTAGVTTTIYIKQNNLWGAYSKVYKKINGSWVEQTSSTWNTILPTGNDYRLIQV